MRTVFSHLKMVSTADPTGFVRLLEGRALAAADPDQGRFRALLRADVAFFLADARDRDAAPKRGGDIRFVPLDAEGRYAAEPADGLTPERLFDRAWALDLLASVVGRLRREYADSGRSATFAALKGVLDGDPRAVPYAELARRLGTTEGAVQVAAHRLRRRYRESIRAAIAATVADPSEVDDEIRDRSPPSADRGRVPGIRPGAVSFRRDLLIRI